MAELMQKQGDLVLPSITQHAAADSKKRRMISFCLRTVISLIAVGCFVPLRAAEPTDPAISHEVVEVFFKSHCVRCHGPSKSKGGLSLNSLDGNLAAGADVERWELVLQMLEDGAMPPDEEPQPQASERQAVVQWIHASLRELERRESQRLVKDKMTGGTATTRRLTNLEYQNSLRDLLGFELKLAQRLPKDPVKAYRFNNTAEFMRMGPEQFDLYLDCARRALGAAIVDPGTPKIHKTTKTWQANAADVGLGLNEVGVYGNRRGSPATGMRLQSWPENGEYRIRVQASAILPDGTSELPLRLVMGYGLDENLAMLQIEPVGIVRLRNAVDRSQVFEFRGRIENHPVRPGKETLTGATPPTLTITPQNLYDDGTLNDDNNFQKTRNVTLPRAVIDSIEFEAPVADVWPPEHHTRILFESTLRESEPDAYVRMVLRRFMSRAYRRPATDDEVEQFAKIYASVLPELETLEAAMRETLALVLVSPQFLFHYSENGENAKTPEQYELAAKLSYFLWSSMPDDELLRLASEGKLDRPEVVEQQVLRLLADGRSRDFVRNFTVQWLSLDKLRTVPINRDLFPRFLYYVPFGERAGTEEPYRPTIRDYMLDETVEFVAELISSNRSLLNIVDSDFACLNQPLAAHYGVPGVQGDELRVVSLKPEYHLGGLLTHGSVLIANGTGSAPHPVYRAVWLREAILGQDVPPPPADVPALTDSVGESAEKALSIKELLARHRQSESCNDCHSRLDPWGIPLEHYNAIGQYQPLVPKEGTRVSGFDKAKHRDLAGYATYLQALNEVAMQADARLPTGTMVNGMDELKAYLLEQRKDDIAKNVVRRLLTYGLGRELSWRDRFAVEALLAQTKQNQYKLRDLIISICQSATFQGR